MTKSYTVYALLEPAECKSYMRYIGITCKTTRRRLQQHINKSKINDNYRCRWIRKLQSQGYVPQIMSLYSNLTKTEAEEIEIELIEYFTYLGAKLVNTTAGGGGCLGYKHSAKTKKLISKLKSGKHIGPKNPNYGNRNSIEVRKKMALHRAKKLSAKDVTEIRRKLKLGKKHKEIARQYGVSRTIVTRIKTGTRYVLVGEQ